MERSPQYLFPADVHRAVALHHFLKPQQVEVDTDPLVRCGSPGRR